MIKLVGIAVVALILTTLLKKINPIFSIFITVCASVIILVMISNDISSVLSIFNEIINKIAASTFAVYLIHCQAIFLPILWDKIVHAQQWQTIPYTAGYELLVACVIYCTATLIDFTRLYILHLWSKIKVRFG